MPQAGPYIYEEGNKATLRFGDRSFSLILSSAYNAGIIGSEYNGIVVLDEDKLNVVLDRHFNTGRNGIGAHEQRVEFERIQKLDWKGFAAFCLANPLVRDSSIAELQKSQPDALIVQDNRDILPLANRDAEVSAEEYPLSGREDIVQFLSSHSVHRENPYSDWQLAWDIKVWDFDRMGRGVSDYPVDEAFDDKWSAHMKGNSNIFQQCADEELSFFMRGDYANNSAAGNEGWKFGTQGRSGGWLVLTDADFGNLRFSGKTDMMEQLRELDDSQLAALYVMTVEVDGIVANREQQMTRSFAYRRSEMEAEWKAETVPAL